MSERDSILARVREALSVKLHRARDHAAATPALGAAEYAAVLPRTGTTFEARLAEFESEARDLRADFRMVSSDAELRAILVALKESEGWRRVAAHHGLLTDAAAAVLGLPGVWVEDSPRPEDMETCDVGITGCDCLVAQTGSVVVTSRSAGGRALSVLPPHHLVLATREQLVGGLPEAFALVQQRYGPAYPSMISFITGPSRTGDIERILVLGAHGPKKLTILMVNH